MPSPGGAATPPRPAGGGDLETPRLFHNDVVLRARGSPAAGAAAAPPRVPTVVRTVSAGASPIKRAPPLVNLEQASIANRRSQVLDDLLLLSAEGVELSGPPEHDARSFAAGERQRRHRSRQRDALGAAAADTSASPDSAPAAAGAPWTPCIPDSHRMETVLGRCDFTDVAFANTASGRRPAYASTAWAGGGAAAAAASPPASRSRRRNGGGTSPSRSRRRRRRAQSGAGSGAAAADDDAAQGGDPAFVYWVREDEGTLGVIDLRLRTRRVLLRGLSRPTRVQVVDERVYWLETGSDWRFDGRLSFLDRTTERVHVLLSGLQLPRGLFVTPQHDTYFLEVQRTQQPPRPRRRRDGGGSPAEAAPSEASSAATTTTTAVAADDADDADDASWRSTWHVRALSGDLVRLAVAGANFALQRRKRTVCVLGDPEDLWWDLDDHVRDLSADVHDLRELSPPPPTPRGSAPDPSIEWVGIASPRDLTVMAGSDDGEPGVLLISMTRYSLPAADPAAAADGGGVAGATAAAAAAHSNNNNSSSGHYSDDDNSDGEDGPGALSNASPGAIACMFNDTLPLPVGMHVDGGAVLWMRLGGEETAAARPPPAAPPTQVMCVLPIAADQIAVVPEPTEGTPPGADAITSAMQGGGGHKKTKRRRRRRPGAPQSRETPSGELVVATLVVCNTRGIRRVELTGPPPRDPQFRTAFMMEHGCGLGAVCVPASLGLSSDDVDACFTPLVDTGVRCFDVVPPSAVVAPEVAHLMSSSATNEGVSDVFTLFCPRHGQQQRSRTKKTKKKKSSSGGGGLHLIMDAGLDCFGLGGTPAPAAGGGGTQKSDPFVGSLRYPWRSLMAAEVSLLQCAVPPGEAFLQDPTPIEDDEDLRAFEASVKAEQDAAFAALAEQQQQKEREVEEAAAAAEAEAVAAAATAAPAQGPAEGGAEGTGTGAAAAEAQGSAEGLHDTAKAAANAQTEEKSGEVQAADATGETAADREAAAAARIDEAKEAAARAEAEEKAAAAERFKEGLMMRTASASLFANTTQGGDGVEDAGAPMQIRVVLRCRPLFDDERAAGALDVVRCTTNDVTVVPPPPQPGQDSHHVPYPKQRFAFERVYSRQASQRTVFDETVRPSIVSAIEGYNVTVFAYGQTGTGKTYTMEGDMTSTERAGIIPRAVYAVFDVLASTCASAGDYEVTVSHLEIYQEEMHDLLSPHNDAESLTARLSKRQFTTSLALAQQAKKNGIDIVYDPGYHQRTSIEALRNGRLMGPLGDVLRARMLSARLREVENDNNTRLRIGVDEERGVVVRNLTERRVKNPEQIFEVLEHSIAKRVTAETLCNGQSSRSHAIFALNVSVKERDPNTGALTGITRVGRLNLVDLSGSENRKRAGGPGVGIRASESRAINQGLLALGRVIKARTERSEHVPFRDSKLTRILEESLGGNCITTLILTVSPNHKEVAETLSTLNYAHKAKSVETKPRRLIHVEAKPEKEDGEGSSDDSDASSDSDDGSAGGARRRRRGKKHNDGGSFGRRPNGGASWRNGRVVMPWVGRVPVRKPQSQVQNSGRPTSAESGAEGQRVDGVGAVPRQEPAPGQARMLHAPSVDWVRTSLMGTLPDDPFSVDAASSDMQEFGFSSARSGGAVGGGGDTRSTAADAAGSAADRRAKVGGGGGGFAVRGAAVAALNEIFRRFDADGLRKLQGYLNSPAGVALNKAVHNTHAGKAGSTGGSRRSRPASASPATRGHSAGGRGASASTSFPSLSARGRGPSGRPDPNNGFARPVGPITQGLFLQLFAAAARIDPIRAAFVVAKLGYRPNFSKIADPKLGEAAAARLAGVAPRPTSAALTKSKKKKKTMAGRRPASAGARRGAAAGGGRRTAGKRPSTAGPRRRRSGQRPSATSFLRGEITPRHSRGPINFFWRWLAAAPPPRKNTRRRRRDRQPQESR